MKPKICLALGGGAARGLSHLGILKEFEDAGMPIDMISGTSLGALVGGLYAARPDARYWMQRVEEFLHSFRSRKTHLEFIRRMEEPNRNPGIFSDMANIIRKSYFWGITATKPAFISETEYEQFIYPLIPDIDITETQIPFGCVATDIRNGKRVFYKNGSLRKAVSASCALPGIFPPVKDGDMLLVDGGWVERVPVKCGCDMGAGIIIAVDVSSELVPFEDKSGLDIILRADAVTRIYLNELLINQADFVIHPNVGHIHWADFSKPSALFLAGEAAAREKLPEIARIIQQTPQTPRGLVEQIKDFRDKIIHVVAGEKG